MTPEQATPGMRVRVMEHHRVEERRGLVGKVVARYGGEEYVAVDVRLADGQLRHSGRGTWRRSPLQRHGGASGLVGKLRDDSGSYSPECVERPSEKPWKHPWRGPTDHREGSFGPISASS